MTRSEIADYALKTVKALRDYNSVAVPPTNAHRQKLNVMCGQMLFERLRFREVSELLDYETKRMDQLPLEYAKLNYAVHSQQGAPETQGMLSRSPPKEDILFATNNHSST